MFNDGIIIGLKRENRKLKGVIAKLVNGYEIDAETTEFLDKFREIKSPPEN